MAIFNSYVSLPESSCCQWLDEQFPAAWFSAASPRPIQGSSDEILISMIKQEQLWPLISLTVINGTIHSTNGIIGTYNW